MILLVTYGVPCPGPVLAVSGSDRSCVQTFLVSQLTGGLYGLTELAGRGLAVEDVAEESVLTIIRYQSSYGAIWWVDSKITGPDNRDRDCVLINND